MLPISKILKIANSITASIKGNTLFTRMGDTGGLKFVNQKPATSKPSALAIKQASEILAVAKEILATDFPNQEALDKYLHEHPDADKSNHRVVKTPEKSSAPEDESAPKQKAPEEKTPEKPSTPSYDKSGGRTRYHRTHPGGTVDLTNYDKNKKDYRNIEIMQDLPMGKLSERIESLKDELKDNGVKDVSDQMLYAMQVHDSVERYTGSGYDMINDGLRRGEDLGGSFKTTIEDIDNFIAYTPKYQDEGTTYLFRGMNVEPEVLDKMAVGAVFAEPAFVSTTSNPDIATKFLSGRSSGKKHVMLTIKNGRGVSLSDYSAVHGGDSDDDSDVPDEKEVLLPRNLKFKIESRKDEKKTVQDMYGHSSEIDVVHLTVSPVE